MALRNSVSAAASVMVGLALIGNVLKGTQDRDKGAPSAAAVIAAADKASPVAAAAVSPPPAAPAKAQTGPDLAIAEAEGIDDSLPTGSIEPGSALHRPNPAAYGDAAKQGSSLILTGIEAINYLAGNTLRREGPGEPMHFTYFASRGVMADGSEREFVARTWDRSRADLCEAGADGAPVCRPVEILLDAKQELQGGRLGSVRIGSVTAELIKGNTLRVPAYIPFIDSAITLDATAPAPDAATAGWAGLVDHTAAITSETGAGRRFVYYGADNRRLDVQPIETGADIGRAVKISVGHWRLSKATLCETGSGAAAQACFKPQSIAGGAVRLVPVAKGGQALRAVALPEARARTVAED